MSSDTSIYSEYVDLTKKYQEKYGKQCVLLMQVGAFFEVYGFRNSETNELEYSEIASFSSLCNLNISEKKATYDGKQVLMAGFRDYTLDKYLQKITHSGFTGVVYVQEKQGKKIVRVLDSIHSPGTYISYENDTIQQTTNNMACIWIDIIKPVSKKKTMKSKMHNQLICGISIANIFTGKSYVSEFQENYVLEHTTFDELERAMVTHSPSEIIFVSPLEKEEIQSILQYSNIQNERIHYIHCNENEKAKKCQQQKYISQILSYYFGPEAYNICSEFQSFPTATQSFCFLLDFIQEHNPNLVKNISLPEFHKTSTLLLANHTLNQLNIIDNDQGKQNGHLSSVNSFLNKCNTAMGKRQFYYQLVCPTNDIAWLQNEYNHIQYVIENAIFENVATARKFLSQIRDIEKICRQLSVKRLYPSSIYYLTQSLRTCQNIYTLFEGDPKLQSYFYENANYPSINNQCNDILEYIDEFFYLDHCQNIHNLLNFEHIFIKPGNNETLDNLVEKYNQNEEDFLKIHAKLNEIIQEYDGKGDIEYVKIHLTEKSGKSLQITKKRGLILKEAIVKFVENNSTILENNNETFWKDLKLKKGAGSNEEIDIPFINKINHEMIYQKEQINKQILVVYYEILENLEKKYYSFLDNIAKYLSKVDVLMNKAYIAYTYNYCCPVIDTTQERSFVEAKDLRHVLIEHIQTNEIYVPNDVSLGNDKISGILLYGTNAVGKTSLIRALGISVVMAQAGLYVPCSSFVYKPYYSIFSRILGNDNLFKGLSTFAVEMSELRVILKMADEGSLILGDELCSGTETESALSIFVAGLIKLHEKQSSHIFATHFHEIVHYNEIESLDKLALKHMSVHYDRVSDALVYDRKLKDGPGDKMYGLEVCKSLHLDEEFMDLAYNIRSKYFPETQSPLEQSETKYNAKKVKTTLCELCNKNIGKEIHHLQHQQEANEKGFIQNEKGTFHKNHVANLMNVCESCHDEIHNKNLSLVRKKTTKGYTLTT